MRSISGGFMEIDYVEKERKFFGFLRGFFLHGPNYSYLPGVSFDIGPYLLLKEIYNCIFIGHPIS